MRKYSVREVQVPFHLGKSLNAMKTLLIYVFIPFLYFQYFISRVTNQAKDRAITTPRIKHHQVTTLIT